MSEEKHQNQIINEIVPKTYKVTDFEYTNHNFTSFKKYLEKFNLFKTHVNKFWMLESDELLWFKKPEKARTGKFFNSVWFNNSRTNITINCIDRHLSNDNKNKAAIIWESESGKNWILTYQLLYSYVNRTANTIKKLGFRKGDKACIICGSMAETIISALACARLGITFNILNPIISKPSLVKRLQVGKFNLIILSDIIYRKGLLIEVKNKVDDSLKEVSFSSLKLIFRRSKNYDLSVQPEVDFLASDFFDKISDECPPVKLEGKHPLFSFFDYDKDGKIYEKFFPTAGFMVQTYTSAKYAFDFTSDDIFLNNSDLSSLVGIAYGIFAPLLHGISNFIYEGLPNFPSQDRIWKIISNYKITKFLSEAYIIKALTIADDINFNANELASLKLISVTGNQLNENDWERIFNKVCKNKIPLTTCKISNDFGNILFSDIPGITEITPGFININFPSVNMDLVNSSMKSINKEEGIIAYNDSCPALIKQNLVLDNIKKKIYLTNYTGFKDDDKIKITGRLDDKLEIGGEIISLKEIQEILSEHPKVKSCRMETKFDSILSKVPISYVELNDSNDATMLFKEELRNLVEHKISTAAKPLEVIFENIP